MRLEKVMIQVYAQEAVPLALKRKPPWFRKSPVPLPVIYGPERVVHSVEVMAEVEKTPTVATLWRVGGPRSLVYEVKHADIRVTKITATTPKSWRDATGVAEVKMPVPQTEIKRGGTLTVVLVEKLARIGETNA